MNKTNFQMLMEATEYRRNHKDEITRGCISEEEASLLRDLFKVASRTELDLQNCRDFVVAATETNRNSNGYHNDESWDLMSAITYIIDEALSNKGEI